MKKSEVKKLLEDNKDPRGMKNWDRLFGNKDGLKSYGIGLTVLRKLAKQVGKDHLLALRLWGSDYHDMKIIAILIDQPERITREQVEAQVEEVGSGMLSHVFSSCNAPLAKSPIVLEVVHDWIQNKSDLRRQCAYGLVYELSKNHTMKELTNKYFMNCIHRIKKTINEEENFIRLAMGQALMGIGKRNKTLNQAALNLAKSLGPIEYDAGDTQCKPLNIVKHLETRSLEKKFASH